jgi:4-hydroxy-tetrahydrodipicolinate synthase
MGTMETRSKSLGGVYAAVTNPKDEKNLVDGGALRRILRFLTDSGIRGFALNGATGEYCLSGAADLAHLLETAGKSLPADASILCGIGAADLRGVLENGRMALAAGARAVLLPMPHFFPYEQHDLRAFCLEVAERLPIDILLYNLPQFTSGLTAATVCDLIRECPPIKGIKDSSGFLGILRALTHDLPGAVRLVGNDGVLPEALQEEVCDGVVSGVAGVCPELVLPLFAEGGAWDAEAIRTLRAFIEKLDTVPVPWGLKWIAESRGLAPARFNLPLSKLRVSQGNQLQAWFRTLQRQA